MMCPTCIGSGVVATAPPAVCPECLGTGSPSDRSTRHHRKERHHARAARDRRHRAR